MLKVSARSDALEPRFEGPYEVLDRRGPDVKLKRQRKIKWHHLSRCKLYSGDTLTLVPSRVTARPNSATEVSVSGQTNVNEANSRERAEPMEGGRKMIGSGDIPEARRYPVRERKAREHFGEVVPWTEMGRRMSRMDQRRKD